MHSKVNVQEVERHLLLCQEDIHVHIYAYKSKQAIRQLPNLLHMSSTQYTLSFL